MDTGATSHLISNARNLSTIFNKCLFPSIHVGDGNSIPVTNTGHSIISSIHRPLYLHNVLVTPNIIKNLIYVRQFTRDNNCTIEFDAFDFSVKDFLTRHILLRCDSSGDFYPVTKPSTLPAAFLTSSSTWHQRLDYPGDEVLRSYVSRQFISCNKEKSSHTCHAFQLGKHVKLPFILQILLLNIALILFILIYRHLPLQGSQVAYLLIYVDGIILTASSPTLLQQIIDSLHNKFDMTDLGALNYFLGIYADRNSTESKLGPNDVPGFHFMSQSYRGGLQYLTFTRPYLSYAIHQVYASATTSLVGYTYADWAGCPFARSAEAEYRGVANVVAETAWLRNLLLELHSPLSTATLVYYDNVSAVYMSDNHVQRQRTKHIEIDIHFVCDMVTAGQIRVLHVPSRYQYADIFTKGLPSALFEEFQSNLRVHPPPALTAGAY
ncbi:ribonuclease H-like domain-containing protein [Tanacetum coccineum]